MYWEDEGPLTDQPETIKKEAEQATVEGSRMSIFDHLAELANRLKKCLYAFIIAFAAVTSVPNPFHPFGGAGSLFGYNFLVISLLRYAEVWTAKNFLFFSATLTTPISVWINLSLALSVIITLPILFGQILRVYRAWIVFKGEECSSKIHTTIRHTIYHRCNIWASSDLPDRNENTSNLLQWVPGRTTSLP